MEIKLNSLNENIQNTKFEIEKYSNQMNNSLQKSNQLRQLGLLILDDLDNRNGLVDSTGKRLILIL